MKHGPLVARSLVGECGTCIVGGLQATVHCEAEVAVRELRTTPSSLMDGHRCPSFQTHNALLWRVQIASILALILAWVYIFDTVLKEREQLEAPKEGIVGAVPRDVEAPPPPPGGPSQPAAAARPTNGPPAPRRGERSWREVAVF